MPFRDLGFLPQTEATKQSATKRSSKSRAADWAGPVGLLAKFYKQLGFDAQCCPCLWQTPVADKGNIFIIESGLGSSLALVP